MTGLEILQLAPIVILAVGIPGGLWFGTWLAKRDIRRIGEQAHTRSYRLRIVNPHQVAILDQDMDAMRRACDAEGGRVRMLEYPQGRLGGTIRVELYRGDVPGSGL